MKKPRIKFLIFAILVGIAVFAYAYPLAAGGGVVGGY